MRRRRPALASAGGAALKAMLLAAGRGERMRPLSDSCPKPLLEAGGRPLIEWQIARLARAGFRDLVINHAHLGAQLVARLGDGGRLGVHIEWSAEREPLETAGGVVHALPLLEPHGRPEVVLIVSADLWTRFDYASLRARAGSLAGGADRLHLVMVPNPPFHPAGDFVLRDDGRLAPDGAPRRTFANIGLYRTDLFHAIPAGRPVKLTPWYREWIGNGWASGELYEGPWHNVGTPEDLARLDAQLAAQRG